ncbi:MAG: B12-binding domain-containing protein [Chloroflexia bacterium]|nr:B12-binding domain-containing protein [Chloroflexia bacterium]
MDFAQLRSEPEYNTRAVVERTGVPADTFRAWERRYGLPQPTRTGGNHRLYSELDLAVIARLRDQTRAGLRISQAVHQVRRTLTAAAIRAAAPPSPTVAETATVGYQVLSERLMRHLVAYNADGANQSLDEAFALGPIEHVCLSVLQPALNEIGERWARGELPVSVEHFASGFALRKIGALFNASRPEFGSPTVVTACAEGELHEVGLLVTSLVLSRDGYRVVHLGASLPTADLREAVDRLHPQALLLAASTEPIARQLADEIAQLTDSSTSDSMPLVCVGGRAFANNPSLGDAFPAHYLGANAMMARDELNRLLHRSA